MPEGVEIEIYRRSAETVVGRTIMSVEAPDPWFLKHGATAATLTDAATHQQQCSSSVAGAALQQCSSSNAAAAMQ